MKTFIKFIALLIALMTAFLIVLLLCRGCYNQADRVRDNLVMVLPFDAKLSD